MNDVRRKAIHEAIDYLDKAREILSEAHYDEEEYRDNIPENLQGSEKYEKADEAVEYLEAALDNIDEAISNAEDAEG